LSTLRKISLLSVILLLSACGDKVPESEAAKRIGQQPKKTVDSVSSKVGDLMQQGQGSERLKEDQK
jgi:hypothetical protein